MTIRPQVLCIDRLADVRAEELRQVVEWWYTHLASEERDFLLNNLYDRGDPEEDALQLRTRWMLCGQDVCRRGFLAAMGISPQKLCAASKGISGTVRRKPAPKEARQAELVHQFFLELYMSAAEPLPHEAYMVGTGVDDSVLADDDPWNSKVGRQSSDEEVVEDWCPDRGAPAVIQDFLGKDIGVSRRYLPHAHLSHLFWLFRSGFASSGVPVSSDTDSDSDSCAPVAPRVPSFPTFWRVWSSTWCKYLRFRKSSQHAECLTCFEARTKINDPKMSIGARLDVARQWKQHLRDQYHDRAIYWYCRCASRRRLDVLTIIIDTMDRAKFAWPQFPWHKVDKRLESMRRPRLVLTGAIAHGYATMFFIADETLSHGAAAFCDVLERVIEHVWAACRRSGVSLPLHLVVQSDNTVAQAKNSLTNVFFAYLVAKCKFQTTSLFYLVVGHTHEDIDQLFGVVLGLVLRRIKWQTKHDLAAALVANLRDRVAARGEELIVQTLEC